MQLLLAVLLLLACLSAVHSCALLVQIQQTHPSYKCFVHFVQRIV